MAVTVTIDSGADRLVLPGGPDVQAEQVWGVLRGGLDQVWGGVEMRADETENPAGDGLLDPGVVRAGGRYLTVTLAHRSHTSEAAEMEARDRIADLLGRRLAITLDTAAGRRYTSGVIKSRPEFVHSDQVTCTCALIIMCADPYWYGDPVVVTSDGKPEEETPGGLEYPLYDGTGKLEYSRVQQFGLLVVPNAGMRPAWPVLRVNNHVRSVRFALGGQVVAFAHPVDGLTIDSATGVATSEGVDVSAWLTRDDFFQVPPGGASVTFRSTPSAICEVEVTPRWL